MGTNEEVLNRAEMINIIARKINAQSYLEIGVQTGKTFREVNIDKKVGVDPDPIWIDQTYLMTSDQFFEQVEGTFDIIFVDGLHHSEQVNKDIENAILRLNNGGVILVDDVAPKEEAWQTRKPSALHWCGDVWRSWLFARLKEEFQTCTYDVAFGIGIMRKTRQINVLSDDVLKMCQGVNNLDYINFRKNFKEVLDFRSADEFLEDWQ